MQEHHTQGESQGLDASAPAAAKAWTAVLGHIRRWKLDKEFAIARTGLKPQRIDEQGRLVLRARTSGTRSAIVRSGLRDRLHKLVTHYKLATGVILVTRGPAASVEPKPLPGPAKAPRKTLQSAGDVLRAASGLPLNDASEEQASMALIGAKEAGEIGYLHSYLAQVFLPRSKPKDEQGRPLREYNRRAGSVGLALTAGRILHTDGSATPLPLPYGAKPRLMLIDVCTRAIQDRSAVVDMEKSARQYLGRLNLAWSAGHKGQYTLFRNQAIALAAARMVFFWHGGGKTIHYDGTPVRGFMAWTDDGIQRSLWPGRLRLDIEFYRSLIAHGLPVDRRAVRELQGSALDLDWYVFFAQRLRRIKPGEPVEVSWQALRDAMAPEYKRTRRFKQKSVATIKRVMAVYPGLSAAVESIPGGLRLKHCPPPVSERKSPLLGDR